jgi:hypothetical protein
MRNRPGNVRSLFRSRGHCVIALSRGLLSVQRVSGSKKSAPVEAHRTLDKADLLEADKLGVLLGAALDEVDGRGLPVHATFGDDLARYFIVTPPSNSARVQDLRAAASVRFQSLYGDTVSSWHLQADWRAVEPFLACAVPRRVMAALEQAVNARRGCLVSVTPNFVGAWNRSRQYLGTHAWLATLDERALTLGLVAATPKPRLASVRTLLLPEPVPPLDWLREQIARMALLDDVSPPSVLYVQGTPVQAWGSVAVTAPAPVVPKLRDSGVASSFDAGALGARDLNATGESGKDASNKRKSNQRGRGKRENDKRVAKPRDMPMVVHWIASGRRAAPRVERRPSRVASFAASLAARFAWGGPAT